MSRRKKPTSAHTIASLDAADAALLELAKIDREVQLLELAMNEEIAAAKAKTDAQAAPLRERRVLLEAALSTFATAGKAELFKKAKSVRLMHGSIGFRASDELKPATKVTWAEVLGKLKAMAAKLAEKGFPDCIRTKEEPDKEALRQLPEDLRAEAGVRIVPKDTFYYEIKTESVAEKAA